MKNVLIWGCGMVGENLARGIDHSKCNVTFCDTNRCGEFCCDGCKYGIIRPAEVDINAYDYFFPGTEPFEKEIIKRMIDLGIDEKKIIPITTDFMRIGRVSNLFTINGYQFVLSIQNQKAIKDIAKKLVGIETKQEILYGMLERNNEYARHIKNIGLVNLASDPNLTERVILKCSKQMVEQALVKNGFSEYEFSYIDFLTPDLNLIAMCDVIVFVGGGIIKLNSAKMDLVSSVDCITAMAEAYDIPVLFVGAGVEEYGKKDAYNKMQRALNRSCVKKITVRENIEAIRNYIYNPNTSIELVADSALTASSTYGLKRKNTNVIGLGTINIINWELNGFPVFEERLYALYDELISEIEKNGFEWRLFSNGTIRDYAFGEQIVLRNERYKGHLIQRPSDDREWMEVMSGFSGIVAPRLHTNIVAYSLGIPCVGMVWNSKVKSFYDMLGLSENAFEPCDFDAKRMVKHLMKTMNEEVHFTQEVTNYQKRTAEEIEDFILKYVISNTDC